MSNKTPITQNTVELQDILATIKNLPEAGGGVLYEEAIDPEGSGRIYKETTITSTGLSYEP